MRPTVPVRPSQRPQHNAGSAVPVPWVSRNPTTLAQVALSALRYRIDDLTNGVVVLEWQTVADPDPTGTITVPSTLNTVQPFNARELRQVTFELTDESGNVTQELAHYELCAVYTGATA